MSSGIHFSLDRYKLNQSIFPIYEFNIKYYKLIDKRLFQPKNNADMFFTNIPLFFSVFDISLLVNGATVESNIIALFKKRLETRI